MKGCYSRAMKCRLVAYYRVSTDKQGRSGLGLQGQEAGVAAHVASTGCELVGVYTEVESGKRADRPELAKAIAHAKRARATLVIAKLDRLARNVHFVSGLMESGVPFVACDNPNANPLTVHILAAVAEDEARRISERTKAALAAYKARGGVLGGARASSRNLSGEARIRGAQTNREGARTSYAGVLPKMTALRDAGKSLREIADAMNAEGSTTRTGAAWTAVQVKRVLDRAA
ncbi:MAG TPA: recombinase family protein [Candidatus Baltobacteraceae bacterium]|nr:recombinase family protein [Candidatus Baltobacteraceae bacterium]